MMNDEMRFCSSEELQEFMATDGTRLIWSVIHKFGKGISMEDAYQESCIAVAHALAMYDPTRERTKKTTYVYQAVYNQIKMMIRHDTTLKRTFERNSTSVEVHINVRDSVVTTEDDIIERISMEDRVNALRGAIREAELSDDEMTVIRLTMADVAQTDIGNRIGSSQSHVSKLKKSAFRKIRECLLNAGWDGVSAPDLATA